MWLAPTPEQFMALSFHDAGNKKFNCFIYLSVVIRILENRLNDLEHWGDATAPCNLCKVKAIKCQWIQVQLNSTHLYLTSNLVALLNSYQ